MRFEVKPLVREALVIGLAAFVAAILAEGYSRWTNKPAVNDTRSGAMSSDARELGAGTRLSIDGARLAEYPLTVLLVTSPTCGYCRNSATFHAQVVRAAHQSGVAAFVAVPDIAAAREYLTSTGLTSATVTNWKEIHIQVTGTPTIVLADTNGVVQRVYAGQLGKTREAEILAAIANPAHLPKIQGRLDTGEPNFTLDQLAARTRREALQIVDVRDRKLFAMGHLKNSLNIPMDELKMRATYELRPEELQAVDCSYFTKRRCDFAVNTLVEAGFRAAAVNAGVITR